MKATKWLFMPFAAAVLFAAAPALGGDPAVPAGSQPTLKSPQDFASIKNQAKQSVALFTEAGKVLTHPRCVNCHPSDDQPRQGEAGQLHRPPVQRGADGFGVTGMRCITCHQSANFDPGRVPGVKDWHLAPIEMAWQGKSLGQICAQLKDPERNGGRTLEAIVTHMKDDHLVGWAWAPGADRQPAPGSQKAFGALIEAWVKTGAACPR